MYRKSIFFLSSSVIENRFRWDHKSDEQCIRVWIPVLVVIACWYMSYSTYAKQFNSSVMKWNTKKRERKGERFATSSQGTVRIWERIVHLGRGLRRWDFQRFSFHCFSYLNSHMDNTAFYTHYTLKQWKLGKQLYLLFLNLFAECRLHVALWCIIKKRHLRFSSK